MGQTSPPSWMGSWWYKNGVVKLGVFTARMASRGRIVEENEIIVKNIQKYVW